MRMLAYVTMLCFLAISHATSDFLKVLNSEESQNEKNLMQNPKSSNKQAILVLPEAMLSEPTSRELNWLQTLRFHRLCFSECSQICSRCRGCTRSACVQAIHLLVHFTFKYVSTLANKLFSYEASL
jgi:hypothetical protein